jgi:4'-phosphopantetheinyl transferase
VISPGKNKFSWLHIWKLDASRSTVNESQLLKDFSAEEIQRAKKFIHDADRKKYITAHYFLRDVLSKYLRVQRKSIEFESGLNGKPLLKNNFSLYFNLSYRDQLFILGISDAEQTGIDVELIREVDDIPAFCKNFFSVNEIKIINEATENEKLFRLFTFWTIKESFIKATAKAFSEPLPLYDLHEFFHRKYAKPAGMRQTWSIGQIDVPDGYVASYAVQAEELNSKIFNYELPPS